MGTTYANSKSCEAFSSESSALAASPYAVSSVSLYIVFEVLSHPDEASMSVLAFFYTLPLLPLLYFSRAVYRRRRDG